MKRLIDTIRIENGVIHNLEWHQQRVDEAISHYFKSSNRLKLIDILDTKAILNESIVRCTISYNADSFEVKYFPYTAKIINRFKLIEVSEIDYHHKYADRTMFNSLLVDNPDYDEVIISQNGHITDTTIANIALFDGSHWITPNTYLLNGTTRRRLISLGMLNEVCVKTLDLKKFKSIKLLNAMLDFEKSAALNIDEMTITY